MTRPPEVSAELLAFIRQEVGLDPGTRIDPAHCLERDWGVTGDEADDFMGAFAQHFSVRPGDFEFHRYFAAEGISGPLFPVTRWLQRQWLGATPAAREPLTVAMLQRAIDLGVWDSQRIRD